MFVSESPCADLFIDGVFSGCGAFDTAVDAMNYYINLLDPFQRPGLKVL